ncbi:protein phosphatase 2C domain-containing protein [Mycobacterium sp. M1]|uniref:Protein phosphatase 2C domain-containing protein n=1 Tax=Mycolicibacter acidiphilus TaxID=2835306 RepID=A0ABS5RQB4_9MYCO|nr:protein phosphatase 2C domain-containing protein [Mycolicibacter acidiphilus]
MTGPLSIPRIIVGQPSHVGEPAAVGTGFRSFPYRPAAVIDGWSTAAATIRAASLRGHLHCYNGAPRQDDVCVHQLPGGRIVVAVADGVSGASQSHLGAACATKVAADWLRAHIDGDLTRIDWLQLYKCVAWDLAERVQGLFGLAEPDPIRAEQELATTLVCAVIEPTGMGALRAYLTCVGDSGAWLLSNGEFMPVLGGKPTSGDGIASAAVTGLPRVPRDITPTVVDFTSGDVLLIGTDGVGDPLGDGQGGVGKLFHAVLGVASPPSVIEFAHAVDFSREMFDDDRTLVAVWPRYAVSGHSDDGGSTYRGLGG